MGGVVILFFLYCGFDFVFFGVVVVFVVMCFVYFCMGLNLIIYLLVFEINVLRFVYRNYYIVLDFKFEVISIKLYVLKYVYIYYISGNLCY